MTYAEFTQEIKSVIFPDRESRNLIKAHNKYILDGLIEIQKRVPELRECNTSVFDFTETVVDCRATVATKPDGPIKKVYTVPNGDVCCGQMYYIPTTPEHIDALRLNATFCYDVPCTISGELTTSGDTPVFVPPGTQPITIARIGVDPAKVIGGNPGEGFVDISAPAPVGGVVVTLTSSKPDIMAVPVSVTITQGNTGTTFPVTTTAVTELQTSILAASVPGYLSSVGIQIAPEPDTDKGFRANGGYFAMRCNNLIVFPNLESSERLVVEWSGIKKSYLPGDQISFDSDVVSAVELYVKAQVALREDCDMQKFQALQAMWAAQTANLIWWYRKKHLPPERVWREPECCGCEMPVVVASDGGGEIIPPPTAVYTIYLGNAGEDAPASYTAEEILAIENGPLGNTTNRSAYAGDYEIWETASGLNEYRIVCIPEELTTASLDFESSGFNLPMDELPGRVQIGIHHYRVFRTTARSVGKFVEANGSEIQIS